MNERVLQFRIGLMVLATLIIAAILVVLFGEGLGLFKQTYTVYIQVREAPGVRRETQILKRGIRIGRVSKVKLTEDGVVITARIDADKRLYRNEICRIYPSVIGEADVNFVMPEGEEPSEQTVQDGDTVVGVVYRDPVRVIGGLEENLARAVSSVADTSSEAGDMIRNIGTVFAKNEERINTIIAKAERNMDIIQETLENANQVLGDPQLQMDLKEAVSQVPELLQQTRTTFGRVNDIMNSVDRNLSNVEGFTEALGVEGAGLISQLNRSAGNLEMVLSQMTVFSQALNRQEGSLGLMLHDRSLYENLNRAAANIEELTRQLRPIVHDARTFTDRIARHPELLGVRGAIQRSPGTKGVPSFSPRR